MAYIVVIARDGAYFKSYKSLMQSKKQNLFCGYHQVLNVVNIKTVEVAFHFFLHLQIMFLLSWLLYATR